MTISPVFKYILRRMLIAVIVLAGVSLVSFTTVYLLPGDPVTSRYPLISSGQRDTIRAELGFDQPLPVQYSRYMKALFRGDLGFSYNTGLSVLEDLQIRLPASLELSMYALLLATALAVPLGIIAALQRNRPADHASRLISIGSLSMPVFWIGLIAIYIFFFKLNWAPAPFGRFPLRLEPPVRLTGLLTIDSLLAGNWIAFVAAWKALALPVIVLSLGLIAPISRITRSAMSEALQEDYVTFARAIGLPEWEVVLKDAFRGSLITILTILGYVLGFVIAGNALVEKIYSWPGIGRYAVDAVVTSDTAALNAIFLLVAVAIALTNLFVDLLYAVADPRVRQGLVS